MRVIIVTYRAHGRADRNTPSSMRSLKFLRQKIERGLYILDQTKLPERQGKLRPEHLSSWPEAGNLLNMPGMEHMEDELDPEQKHQEQAACLYGLTTDGTDHGPAPMQSGECPDEICEGNLGGQGIYHPPSQQYLMTSSAFRKLYIHSIPLLLLFPHPPRWMYP
jgi:hypothetical protein